MSGKNKALAAVLLATLLVAAMIPSAAVALVGVRGLGGKAGSQGSVDASRTATTAVARTARRATLLQARIDAALKRHAKRFDPVSTRLATRITKVGTLADKVAAAGGDVASARTLLGSAQQHVLGAKSLEAQAIAAFQAIPTAADRRTAFASARTLGRDAVRELAAARKDLRAAVVNLRGVIAGLKSAAAPSASGTI